MDAFEKLLKSLAALDKVEGITPIDLLQLPHPLDKTMRKLLKKGSMTLAELAAEINLSEDETRRVGEALVEKGYLHVPEETNNQDLVYRTYFARMRKHNIPLDL